MKTELFDYELPADRIAQKSVEPRESAKLLVLDRTSGSLSDHQVSELPALLKAGDLLIFNDSKVFKARLKGRTDDGKDMEIFLLRPEGNRWIVLAKPGRDLGWETAVHFMGGAQAMLKQRRADGTYEFDFGTSPEEVFALADRIGEVPVPPYVEPNPENTAGYQTIYAKHVGSVAAPTAGFHFTNEIFQELETKGIKQAYVTLHVGLGTFRPMKSETLDEHVMHSEWADVPEATQKAIAATKTNGGRVIVVGTTALRALEAWASENSNSDGQSSWSGFTEIFIKPGFEFKVADGLITNFHLPKSTLLVLVSAFAGREKVLSAYQHAIDKDYRFYSFGDAMLIT